MGTVIVQSSQFTSISGAEHNKVLVGKEGLFARFPFIGDRCNSMNFLISNRNVRNQDFLDLDQTPPVNYMHRKKATEIATFRPK